MNGTILSLFFPNEYPPNLHCTYVISLPTEYLLNIIIVHLDLEQNDTYCRSDFLNISSISENGSTINLGIYCNSTSNEMVLQSSSSKVLIQFSSNYRLQGNGFIITYQATQSCTNFEDVSLTGQFQSVNFPRNYLNSQRCQYTLGRVSDEYAIEVEFDTFHVESGADDRYLQGRLCNLDYVDIQMDSDFVRICGHWKGIHSKLTFRSFSGKIEIMFTSNEAETRLGFSARWRPILKNSSVFSCPSLLIDMPDYSLEYIRWPRPWSESQADCSSRGGSLVVITDEEEQTTISDNITDRYV